jgi:hypothetical protein
MLVDLKLEDLKLVERQMVMGLYVLKILIQ